MDTGTMFGYFGWVLLALTWFSLWNLQGKIWCQFHRKDRTVIDRNISMKDKMVKFGKGWYDINPKRFSIKWRKVWGLLPYPMLFQEWKWDTDQPVDPTTFRNTHESPEAKAAADSEKEWRNANQGIDSQIGGRKEGFLGKWLPFITIGAVVIVAFLVYQQGSHLSVIEQQIQSLAGMIKATH